MLSPVVSTLAEAVVTELNSPAAIADIGFTAWSQQFTAQRVYNAEIDAEKAEKLLVHVQSGRVKTEAADRGDLGQTCDVLVYVRQAIDVANVVKVDALLALAEEIDRYFFSLPDRRLRSYTRATWDASELVPFHPGRIRNGQLFEAVLVITFLVYDADDEA